MQRTKTLVSALVAVLAAGCVAATGASAIEWLVKTAGKKGELHLLAVNPSLIITNKDLERIEFVCKEGTLSGKLTEGLVSGQAIGDILDAAWNAGATTCETFGASSFEFGMSTEATTKPWLILAVGHAESEKEIELVLHVTKISITSKSLLIKCAFEVEGGLLPAYWLPASQVLRTSRTTDQEGFGRNTLTVKDAVACPAVIENGAKPVYETSYKADPEGQEITIKLGP